MYNFTVNQDMTRGNSIFALAAVLLVTPGCATAIRGTTEEVTIITAPTDATIATDIGLHCTNAPCRLIVPRKQAFVITATKDGYKPATLSVTTRMSGEGGAALVGNVLIGGIIGIGVDAASGATLDHSPNPAVLVLEPIDPSNPATPVPPPPVVPQKSPTGSRPANAPPVS